MADEQPLHEADSLDTLDDLCLTHVASCSESLKDLLNLGSTCRRLRAVVAGADAAWQRRIYADFGLIVQGTSLKRQYTALRRVARGELPPQQQHITHPDAGGVGSGGGAGPGAGPSSGAGAGPSGAGPSTAAAPSPFRPFLPFTGVSTDGGCDQPASDFWVGHLFTPSMRSFYSSEARTKNIQCIAVLQPGGLHAGPADSHRTYLLDRLKLPAAYLRHYVLRSILTDQAWEEGPSQEPDTLPPLPDQVVGEAYRELSACSTPVLEDLFMHCYRDMRTGRPWGVLLIAGMHAGVEALMREQRATRLRVRQYQAAFNGREHNSHADVRQSAVQALREESRLRGIEARLEEQLHDFLHRLLQHLQAAAVAEAAGGGAPVVPRPPEGEVGIAMVLLKASQIGQSSNTVPYAIQQADRERQPRLMFVEPPLRPLLRAPAGAAVLSGGQRRREERVAVGATVGLFDTVLLGRPPHVTCAMRCGALFAGVASAEGRDAGEAGGGAAALAAALNNGLASVAYVKALSDAADARAVLSACRSGALPPAACYRTNGWIEWIEFHRPGEQQAHGAASGGAGPSVDGSAAPAVLSLPEHGLRVRVLPVLWFRFYSRSEQRDMLRSWQAHVKSQITAAKAAMQEAAATVHTVNAGQLAGAGAQAAAASGPETQAGAPPCPVERQAVRGLAAAMAAALAAADSAAAAGGAGGVEAQGADGTLRIMVAGQQVFEAPLGSGAAAAVGAGGGGGAGGSGQPAEAMGQGAMQEAEMGEGGAAGPSVPGLRRPRRNADGGDDGGGIAAAAAAAEQPGLAAAGGGRNHVTPGKPGPALETSSHSDGGDDEPSDDDSMRAIGMPALRHGAGHGGDAEGSSSSSTGDEGDAGDSGSDGGGGDAGVQLIVSDEEGEGSEEDEEEDEEEFGFGEDFGDGMDDEGDAFEMGAHLPFDMLDLEVAHGMAGLGPGWQELAAGDGDGQVFNRRRRDGGPAGVACLAAAAAAAANAALAAPGAAALAAAGGGGTGGGTAAGGTAAGGTAAGGTGAGGTAAGGTAGGGGAGAGGAAGLAAEGEPGVEQVAMRAVPVLVPLEPVFPLSPTVAEVAPGVGRAYGWTPPAVSGNTFSLRLRQPWCANLLLAKLVDCEDARPGFNRARGGCNIDAGNIAVQGPAPFGSGGDGGAEGGGQLVHLLDGVELA